MSIDIVQVPHFVVAVVEGMTIFKLPPYHAEMTEIRYVKLSLRSNMISNEPISL